MEVIEVGWYANSFSIPFDYSRRNVSAYKENIRTAILSGINEYIEYNGLYSDSGAIMPKMDVSCIFESKAEAEDYVRKVVEKKGYDYSIAVPYNDFIVADGEYERLVQEMNDIELKRQELTKSASDAVLSKKIITCRNCGFRQSPSTLYKFQCKHCLSDVRSITKLNQRKTLFNRWVKLNKKVEDMRFDKKNIYLLIRFAFHC